MAVYPVALTVFKRIPGGLDVQHVNYLVEAVSEDEARGKGFRIVHRLWPAKDGWGDHNVCVGSLDVIDDPDGAIIVESPRGKTRG